MIDIRDNEGEQMKLTHGLAAIAVLALSTPGFAGHCSKKSAPACTPCYTTCETVYYEVETCTPCETEVVVECETCHEEPACSECEESEVIIIEEHIVPEVDPPAEVIIETPEPKEDAPKPKAKDVPKPKEKKPADKKPMKKAKKAPKPPAPPKAPEAEKATT